MSAETPAAPGSERLRVIRRNFRTWRGTRPFWAGLFVMLAGLPIGYFPYADLHIGNLTMTMATTAGAGSLIIGVLLGVLGLCLWFQRHIQIFCGVAAILLGLVSIPVSNLGGFFIGFLLALIGGAMAIAWAPGRPDEAARTAQADSAEPLAAGPEHAAATVSFAKDDGARDEHDSGTVNARLPEARRGGLPADEWNELSSTNPANEVNGRHSAG
ncbi:DUF6114 domain-containing protein [Streptomyces fragilis]|uniref:DUF6114 domain-containing protein n=1 Tax=Streptomyces fragilis TaxID=67301 RepID=A0ABV2YA81_9ACTN|nr:DUF6114 domain-containing protein [Streptomyces fragilis]